MNKLSELIDSIISEVDSVEKTAAVNGEKVDLLAIKTDLGTGLLKVAAECRSLAQDTSVSYSDMQDFWERVG